MITASLEFSRNLDLTEQDFIDCGYSQEGITVGTVWENVEKKLNKVELETVYALFSKALSRKSKSKLPENQQILYWRKRYLGAKSRCEKMKAERDYWRDLWQKDFKEAHNGSSI